MMNFEEASTITQERLQEEAESLGELLERLRSLIPPALIGEREWDELIERARELPSTMAAFPFGFELRLHERRPRADLGVSVVGGTTLAEFFQQMAQSEDTDAAAAGVAELLFETDSEESALREVVGRKMMLEFDIGLPPGDPPPDPGIFLRPSERPIVGDGAEQRIRDLNVVIKALVSAAGWTPDDAERRQVERLHRAQTADTRIESIGAFPSRERAIRLAVIGLRTSGGVMAFLRRAGWPGQHEFVADTLSRLEQRGGFVELGVHMDVHAHGLGPTLGLNCLAKERRPKDSRHWLDRPDLWTTFIDSLREEGLGVDEKLSALAEWSPEPTTLFGKFGPFLLLRGIHHIKLVLAGDRIQEVKAYPYMVLLGMPVS